MNSEEMDEWREVRRQVSGQVWWQVRDQVWGQVRGQVSDQVWDQARDHIHINDFQYKAKVIS